jgi:hypothetical protein
MPSDDHPTLPGHDSVTRRAVARRTDPHGYPVPVEVIERPSRRLITVEACDDSGPIGTLDDRVTVLERGARGFRRRLWGLLAGVATSLGAVLIWALNAREAVGGERVRAQVLERDLERVRVELEQLRTLVYRAPPDRWRDAPSFAPMPAAPSIPPAQKEPGS